MRGIAIIFLVLCHTICHAQKNIWGRVADSATGKPLQFVTIKLLTQQNTPVKIAVTDSAGNYMLQAVFTGNYQLLYSLVGYDSTRQSIMVAGDAGNINQPVLLMPPAAAALRDVTVVAHKPIIEKQI